MSGERNPNLTPLFTELHNCNQDGDNDKALKVINKILQEDKTNSKAIHCKIICLIQIGEFELALNEINSITNSSLSNLLLFEKAYCQYRLNNVNDALKTLDEITDQKFCVKELRAQTLYRLERYQESYKIYLNLIKNSEDDYEDEREANLGAVVARLTINDETFKSKIDLNETTFEQCYNKACILLGQRLYDEALEKLNLAEERCRKTLEEEGASEEEIESELSIIRSQIGFCYRMLNKQNLPSIDEIISSVDVEKLETSNWSLGAKYVQKSTKVDTESELKKRKKKKKRKKILPKNYDPNVDPDPERWLPSYQRSTYKKKKDKRLQNIGKGTQGTTVEAEVKPTKTTTNHLTASPQPQGQGPRQQRPTQKKKKKTGKR